MRHHRHLLISALLLAGFLSGARSIHGAVFTGESATAQYENAVSVFNQGAARRAEGLFKQVLQRPDLPFDLQDNAYYWLGECDYARHAWQDALSTFLKVLEFADSNKEEDARLKIALCWQNLKEPERACLEARVLVERFPQGTAADRARRLLKRCPPESR